MWKCPNCETLNNTEVCAVCGHQKVIEQKRPEAVCPYCNTPLNTGDVFCRSCGNRLSQSSNNYSPQPEPRNTKPDKNGSKNTVLIVIMSILLLAVVVLALKYATLNNESAEDASETSTPVATEQLQTVNPTQLPMPTAESNKTLSVRIVDADPEKFGLINFAYNKSSVASIPSYSRLVNDTCLYYCDYPRDFTHSQQANMEVFTSPDNTAVMKVYARKNSYNQTVKGEYNSTVNAIGGTIEYSSSGDDWYAVSITKNGIAYYVKGYVDEYIREFIFYFHNEYLDFYDEYIEHIEDNFKRTN